jgi:hypothetical protein
VVKPADWPWSSFRHYATGEMGAVEIESQWTARARERAGVFLTAIVRAPAEKPRSAELERSTLKFRKDTIVRADRRSRKWMSGQAAAVAELRDHRPFANADKELMGVIRCGTFSSRRFFTAEKKLRR